MGIHRNETVEKLVQSHRRRRHQNEVLNQIEEVIHQLRIRGLTNEKDVSLWKCK